jgi:hypothetical protein
LVVLIMLLLLLLLLPPPLAMVLQSSSSRLLLQSLLCRATSMIGIKKLPWGRVTNLGATCMKKQSTEGAKGWGGEGIGGCKGGARGE